MSVGWGGGCQLTAYFRILGYRITGTVTCRSVPVWQAFTKANHRGWYVCPRGGVN
jgi:tRNA 2-selenouridine synthase SelU